jgi:formiminoglutamase
MAHPPHVSPAPVPLKAKTFNPKDPRALNLVQGAIPEDAVPRLDAAPVHMIGVPYDTTVPGRKGAAMGPAGIREAFRFFGTHDMTTGTDIAGLRVADHGDLLCEEDPRVTHRRLSDAVCWVYQNHGVPFILGGDNSITYGAVEGLARSRKGRIGIVIIDAHYDLREVEDGHISSGTPFYRILHEIDEDLPGRIEGKHLVEIGIRPMANSGYHAKLASRLGLTVITDSRLRRDGIEKVTKTTLQALGDVDHIWFSVDMDGVDPAHAPGVSAPIPGGLQPHELNHLARTIARDTRFAGLDINETAPPLDPTGNTTRVAALCLLNAMAGHVERDQSKKA